MGTSKMDSSARALKMAESPLANAWSAQSGSYSTATKSVSRSGYFALPVIGLTSDDATVVSARPTAIDHIAPPIVIVHALPGEMQAQQVVAGCGMRTNC